MRICLLIALFVNCAIVHPLIAGTPESSMNACVTAVERLNPYLVKMSFRPIVMNSKTFPSVRKFSYKYNALIDQVGDGRFPSVFFTEVKTGDIVEFINLSIIEESSGPGCMLYNKPTVPGWPKEKAVEVAKECLHLLTGRNFQSLVLKQVTYSSIGERDNKFLLSSWLVHWVRVDKAGHAFLADAVTVQIQEPFGPTSISIKMLSSFTEADFEPLKYDEALSMARIAAAALQKWPPAADHLSKFDLLDDVPRFADLLVVNPNYLTSHKSVEEAVAKKNSQARLAWVFSFDTMVKDASAEGAPKNSQTIDVWIDAQNGDVLGGDFSM